MKHWKLQHVPVVAVFQCPLCTTRSNRKCEVTRHLRFNHNLSTENAQKFIDSLRAEQCPNNRYVDPGCVLPRKLDKEPVAKYRTSVDVKAREEAQRRRREEALANKVEFPNLEGAVLVPRDMVAYVYQVPGLGQRLQLKPKPGW